MTEIAGEVSFNASVHRARNAVRNLNNLRLFLQADATLKPVGDAEFEFAIVRDFGLLSVRMPGTLTLTEDPSGDLSFSARTAHPLAGGAVVAFTVRFSGDRQRCTLGYRGKVEASGLLSTVLERNIDRVESRLNRVFGEIGRKLARGQGAYEARCAAKKDAIARQGN